MTPFDTAIRVQRREVDTLRVSISIEVERLSAAEAECRSHDARIAQERALATAIPIASDAWRQRADAERRRIADRARIAAARLAQLRAQAIEVYGTMRAIEGAADRYRDEAQRAAAAAEQDRIDDLAGARFAAAQAIARRRSA